jgi:hypothetical protein
MVADMLEIWDGKLLDWACKRMSWTRILTKLLVVAYSSLL